MLGTGERKYSKEEVAKNLVKSVENFNDANPHKFLWKVIVVVEENDRDSLMALKKHVKDRRVVSESVQITLLGVRKEDVNEADGILERCLNEQTGYYLFSKTTVNFKFENCSSKWLTLDYLGLIHAQFNYITFHSILRHNINNI